MNARAAVKAKGDEAPAASWRDAALQERPGTLIRRLHQIHTALFLEECASEGITPVQYSVLSALEQFGPSEQIVLARAVGLDRATTAGVIGRLVEKRFVQSYASRTDKRKRVAELTKVGRALLIRLEPKVGRAHERTLAALSERNRVQFMRCLRQLVEANNEISRAPVGLASDDESAHAE
ncbi:MAG TPA: MarR family transcriptional regulator [Trinickia sp.]|uniref:MarR family winged helix-turn-helix transcriptional regulator n=1 Tax=Trinickia sp. TaxID=2571163 RepID=UPI002C585211|nr:MarR family transcriptional regulator [Trinickia sp.]HTI16437.1 MarR family transcriptional regulator [Trinickia sp.]